jgi:hypothetical protein
MAKELIRSRVKNTAACSKTTSSTVLARRNLLMAHITKVNGKKVYHMASASNLTLRKMSFMTDSLKMELKMAGASRKKENTKLKMGCLLMECLMGWEK